MVNESDLIKEKAQQAATLAFKHGKNAAEHSKHLMQNASTQGLPFLAQAKNFLIGLPEKTFVISVIGLMFFIIIFFDAWELNDINATLQEVFIGDLSPKISDQIVFAFITFCILVIPVIVMLLLGKTVIFRYIRPIVYTIPLLLAVWFQISFVEAFKKAHIFLGANLVYAGDALDAGLTNIFLWLYILAILLIIHAVLKFKAKNQ